MANQEHCWLRCGELRCGRSIWWLGAIHNRTKLTGGTGMRYYVPPGDLLLTRIDVGYSTEGTNVYLTFDHPF